MAGGNERPGACVYSDYFNLDGERFLFVSESALTVTDPPRLSTTVLERLVACQTEGLNHVLFISTNSIRISDSVRCDERGPWPVVTVHVCREHFVVLRGQLEPLPAVEVGFTCGRVAD